MQRVFDIRSEFFLGRCRGFLYQHRDMRQVAIAAPCVASQLEQMLIIVNALADAQRRLVQQQVHLDALAGWRHLAFQDGDKLVEQRDRSGIFRVSVEKQRHPVALR